MVSSLLLASTPFSVADGIAAKAALSGANTVMLSAEFSVFTRPALVTAVTRVDSTGLAEAAVATGAVDMPVKLPAPVLGTAEHPRAEVSPSQNEFVVGRQADWRDF